MQPRLLKTSLAEYVKETWTGKNECGYRPIGDRVLVLPDTAAEKSSGQIHFTPTQVERSSMAAESGVLVELGEGAFAWNSDRSRPFEGYRPKPGDRVCFERYGGQLILGDDGRMYRMMDDKNIGGVEQS